MKKIKNLLRPIYHAIQRNLKFFRRIGFNKDVCILCNNCSAGFIYQHFGLTYNTPTVGLFFTTEDFVKLCKNPKHYFSLEIEFIDPNNSKNYNILKDTNKFSKYPVGKIDDIEIYFMHYASNEEAAEKWYRRIKRISYENMFFLLTENEFATEELIKDFCEISPKRAICLAFNKYPFENSIFVKQVSEMKEKSWLPKFIINSNNWKKVFKRSNV